ncbi:response regulator transcription factor [Streptomyces sp. NPDC079167]|uniref:response regulator n=1 Tax=Streptomyces sp. NPDC079167 TaxID=3154513 RepID=UPI003448BA6D
MSAETPERRPGSPFRVILCDDNVMLLEILSEVVQAQPDMEVVGSACNDDQALQLAKRHQPDLVILDVRFPGGGPSVAKEIARCSPASRIVAFSAYDDTASAQQMRSAGVSEYVLKGMANRELLAALRRAAEESR